MKEEIISKLKSAREELLKALNNLDDDKEIYEGWTKKELLSHIAGWDEEGVDSLPKILKGEKPISFRMSINGYNKRSVEKRKRKNIKEIYQEMKNLRKEFISQIKKLKQEQLTNFYGTTLGKKQINLMWLFNEAITHDLDHAKGLKRIK